MIEDLGFKPAVGTQLPQLSLSKDTGLTLADAPKTRLDTVRASTSSPSIPWEVYFNPPNGDLNIEPVLDTAEAESLKAAALTGMAAKVLNPQRSYQEQMERHAPRFAGTTKDVFSRNIWDNETHRYSLATREIPERDHPPVEVREAIVNVLESTLFTTVEIVRYGRLNENGLAAKEELRDHRYSYRNFAPAEDQYEVEYALVGTSKYDDEYLLARWGWTLKPLVQLTNEFEIASLQKKYEREQQLIKAREQKIAKARAHHNWALFYKSYHYLGVSLPVSLWLVSGLLVLVGAVAAANVLSIVAFFTTIAGIVFCLGGFMDDRDFIVKHIVDKESSYQVDYSDRHFKLSDYPSPRQLKKRGEL